MPRQPSWLIAIWIIHVYAAIWVRGTISAMTRGFVTGGWGWRHHRKWLREEVGRGQVEAVASHGGRVERTQASFITRFEVLHV